MSAYAYANVNVRTGGHELQLLVVVDDCDAVRVVREIRVLEYVLVRAGADADAGAAAGALCRRRL